MDARLLISGMTEFSFFRGYNGGEAPITEEDVSPSSVSILYFLVFVFRGVIREPRPPDSRATKRKKMVCG
ncbi:MAG: hypothetical protein PWP04_1009 [Candidatus Atribacteria bacterium]|nr:hypothetical protein [Candidatus Atribacteria bacterium]